jgi:hypothetical protein
MKSLLLSVVLFGASITLVSAQSRVSIAPTYWFNYNPYSYQVQSSFNGSNTQFQASGHNLISSFGLAVRYHFTPRWDLSLGGLYYKNTDYIKSPQGPYGESEPFTSEGWQLPILVSYRLTDRRLSPYFSTGAIFTKSQTFTGRPLTTDGVIGIGLNYRVDSRLSILLQPTASYSFYRPASNASFSFTKYNSYSLGLQTQLIWNF